MLAEQSLIGSILVGGEKLLDKVRHKITSDDFQIEGDGALYCAACALADDGETIDPVSVLSKSAENGAEIDAEYVRDIMLLTPSVSNIEIYASEVIKLAARQRLKSLIDKSTEKVNSGEPVSEICSWLRSEAAEMAERTSSGGLITGTHALLKFTEYRRELEAGNSKAVVSTGYAQLDEVLGGGLVNEGLYFLGARPGCGKTTLALNIAGRVSERGIPVLFVSLEMSINQLTAKRLSIATGISSTWLLNNPDNLGDKWKEISSASRLLSECPLQFNRASGAAVGDIGQLASQIKGLGMLVIDYFGLINHAEGRSLYEKATHTSNSLKRLARSLGVPVLCLAQLNREVEGRGGDGKPRVSDLRDSGAAEQDADGVLLLHRFKTDADEKRVPVPLEIIVGKNRHGGTGNVNVNFYLVNGRVR